MKELWDSISKVEKLLEDKKASGADSKDIYYLKHFLIDLRKQQYYLVDSIKQELPPPQNKGRYYGNSCEEQLNYPVYPRGVMSEENSLGFKRPRTEKGIGRAESIRDIVEKQHREKKPYFNFLNKEHIYWLVLFYWDIKSAVRKTPDSPLNNLLWTLDFYIEKAELNEQQRLIVRDKKLRTPNKEIKEHLEKELGIYHQENYISTIWNKITQSIVDAAELNYDEWLCKDYDKAWKVCHCCGEELLRDPRNFVRKSRSSDGLTGTCKRCNKRQREEKKVKEKPNT